MMFKADAVSTVAARSPQRLSKRFSGGSRRRSARRGAKRGGSVVVIVGLSMVGLLGFCSLGVDYGILVATKNRLQRTCDAAALAAAPELPAHTAAAQAMAKYYAEKTAYENGVPVSEITVSFPDAKSVSVTANRRVNTLFARAIGILSNKVNAGAVAGRQVLKGLPGAAPIAITVEDYKKFSYKLQPNGKMGSPLFDAKMVRNHDEDFEDGTFVAMDLRPGNNGKSGAHFENDLANGYEGETTLDEPVHNALNSSLNSQGAKMLDAINDRIARAKQAPWNDSGLPAVGAGAKIDNIEGVETIANSNLRRYTFPNYQNDNPRIMTIMVADPNGQDNNNPLITARFFAPVYIESVQEVGKDNFFIRMRILPKLTYSSTDPNVTPGDASTPDTGVGAIRLLS